MIITNSCIGMESARTYTSVSTDAYLHSRSVTQLSAKDFMDSLGGAFQRLNSDDKNELGCKKSDKPEKEDADTLSGNAEGSLEYLKGKFNEISAAKISRTSKQEEELRSAIRYLCLNFLLMLIFGKNGGSEMEDIFSRTFGGGPSFSQGDLNSLSFTEVSESVTVEHYEMESESTTFSSKGIVKTSDGREIDFNIDFAMSRSFESFVKETGRYESLQVNLMDPLVINLDTYAANVSDQKFYFDLDADGVEDAISTLSSGSGFLALDRNEDGMINDGSELFGTKSGDGFKDLSQYDEDGNGFIDEADEVFDKLKIFCINDDGTTSLYSLKEKGVGAIYLGSSSTEFSLTNQENSVNAQIRKRGMFLYETGSAGTIQHVDLAVELGA